MSERLTERQVAAIEAAARADDWTEWGSHHIPPGTIQLAREWRAQRAVVEAARELIDSENWYESAEADTLRAALRAHDGGEGGGGRANQPLPITSSRSVEVAPLVIEDIRGRIEQGIRTYGQPLRTFNGRSALQDAYEEALDLAQYLKQKILEEADRG